MLENVKIGLIRGTGAAANIELGWIPEYVKTINLTDGNKIHEFFLYWMCAFTSGGTTEVKAGDLITGATSGATARVAAIMLDTGSWAGGDAAGWIVVDRRSIVGTWQAENAYVPGGSNDITLSAAFAELGVDVDTEVAGATGNAGIEPYIGSAGSNALGFTIGSTVSTDAKILGFIAMRSGPGSAGRIAMNSA